MTKEERKRLRERIEGVRACDFADIAHFAWSLAPQLLDALEAAEQENEELRTKLVDKAGCCVANEQTVNMMRITLQEAKRFIRHGTYCARSSPGRTSEDAGDCCTCGADAIRQACDGAAAI